MSMRALPPVSRGIPPGAGGVRFAGTDKPNPSESLGLIIAPSGSVGMTEAQMMVKTLYDAVCLQMDGASKEDRLKRLGKLSLADKAGLIQQFRDVTAMAISEGFCPDKSPDLVRAKTQLLYNIFRSEILDAEPDSLEKQTPDRLSLLTRGTRDLAWLYVTMGMKMPVEFKASEHFQTDLPTNLDPERLADVDAPPDAGDIRQLTAQLNNRRLNGLISMTETLYETIKPRIYGQSAQAFPDNGQRQALIQCLNDLRISAALLNIKLGDTTGLLDTQA